MIYIIHISINAKSTRIHDIKFLMFYRIYVYYVCIMYVCRYHVCKYIYMCLLKLKVTNKQCRHQFTFITAKLLQLQQS